MSSKVLPTRPAFCRYHPLTEALVVSTYQLDSSSSTRSGSIYVLEKDLEERRVIDTGSGVFRFEFAGREELIAALTDGSLIYGGIDCTSSTKIPVSDVMLLDVAYSNATAITTDNSGNIFVVDVDTETVVATWHGHSLPYTNTGCEVWTCSYDHENSTIATGGEDALLKVWDSRSHTMVSSCKLFEAGVTFSSFLDEKKLLTGSYDQKIRLLDLRNMKLAEAEVETPGGVWNIEECVYNGNKSYLAACMYGGWHMFDENFKLIKGNEEAGKELLYGATLLSDVQQLAYVTFNNYTVSLETV